MPFGKGREAAGAANQGAQLGIDELRRQFGITQENLAPFIQAGTQALPGVTEGTTAGGLDERLAQIFNTDIFGSLVDERTRAVQGQLSAGGLTRSGTALEEIAGVPTDVGLGIEQTLFDRLSGLAGQGLSAVGDLGRFGAQQAGSLAELFGQQGQNLASGILTDAQAGANAISQVISIASKAFFASDPLLKENVEPITTIGDLQVFEWDWIEGAKGTFVEKCPTIGFMADDVQRKYPQFVKEYCGFKVIAYHALLDELTAKFGHTELKAA